MMPLAHHPLTEALAFGVPVLALAITLAVLVVRERLGPGPRSAQDAENPKEDAG